MKIRFTRSARDQLLTAIEYIRRDRVSAALRFRKQVQQRLTRLVEYPDSGRRIPEFPELPYRELILGSYRFFYRVEGDVVWIVAVWHGAQLPEKPGDADGDEDK